MKRIFLQQITFLLVIASVLTACAPAAHLPKAADIKMPNSFGIDTVADMPLVLRNQFFTDPYLAQHINTALQQNADLQIAVQRIEIARSYFKGHAGALFPTLDIVGTASATRYGDYTMEGVGNADLSPSLSDKQKLPSPVVPNYYLGLNSNWEIDVWGKLRNKKRAAYMRYLATENGRNLVITSLVAEVAYRYYELLALDNELEIVQRNIELQQKAYDIVLAQKESGRATELAVKQFSAQLLHTRNLENEAKQNIVRVENELNFLMGRYTQQVQRSNSFRDTLPSILNTGIPSAMLTRRPDIRQAELEMKAANYDVGAARAAFFPSLTLTSYAGYNSFNSSLLFGPASWVYGILGGITAPVFNQNLLRSGHKRAVAESRQAYYTYQKTVLNAYNEVMTNLASIDNTQKSYALYQQESKELGDAINIANELYLAGYASYLEVITAQRNAIEADLNVIKMKKGVQVSLINLYRSLGGGWE